MKHNESKKLKSDNKISNLSKPTRGLSPREVEVIALTAQGKTRGEIATILAIGNETVKAHIKNACNKLDVANKTQAAIVAYKMGIIELDRQTLLLPQALSHSQVCDDATINKRLRRTIPHKGNSQQGDETAITIASSIKKQSKVK